MNKNTNKQAVDSLNQGCHKTWNPGKTWYFKPFLHIKY